VLTLSLLFGIPGLTLFCKYSLSPDLINEHLSQARIITEIHNRKKMLARMAMLLLILSFGFLLMYLMLSFNNELYKSELK
jgi:hypothetical protein